MIIIISVIIVLLTTDKSQYFAQPVVDYRYFLYYGNFNDLPSVGMDISYSYKLC